MSDLKQLKYLKKEYKETCNELFLKEIEMKDILNGDKEYISGDYILKLVKEIIILNKRFHELFKEEKELEDKIFKTP